MFFSVKRVGFYTLSIYIWPLGNYMMQFQSWTQGILNVDPMNCIILKGIPLPSRVFYSIRSPLRDRQTAVDFVNVDYREQNESHGASFQCFRLHLHFLIQRSGWWKTQQPSKVQQQSQQAPFSVHSLPPATLNRARLGVKITELPTYSKFL